MAFETDSCIRGFHIYKEIWSPQLDEILSCVREIGNREDPFAVAVMKDSNIVGHLPRSISCICSLFLRHSGSLKCRIVGGRRRSVDLPQGGLEIPCVLLFEGSEELLKKVRKRLNELSVRDLCSKKIEQGDGKSKTLQLPFVEEIHDDQDPELPGSSLLPVDERNMAEFEESNSETPWIRFKDIILLDSDHKTIRNREKLNDKHINFAQRLLKEQFPHLNGLRLTLLQNIPHDQPTSNAIQVIHVRDDHWIVAATKPGAKSVQVYDSLFSALDQVAIDVIKINFCCSASAIQMLTIQKQTNATNCGLFAIAVATSIAFGENPSERTYQENYMHKHLLKCFEQFSLIPFP